jgi:hypothetical protein
MNHSFKIGILGILLLFASCSKFDTELDLAGKQLTTSPEEALTTLMGIQTQSAPSRSRARYALLMSLALDKNYIDVTDDSLARVAADYYARHGSKRERMLSLYSLGRVRSNAGDRIGALLSFHRAEELARGTGDDHYLGLILRNEGELFGATHDYRQQQRCYALSAEAFERSGEGLYAAYSTLALARNHSILGDLDGADSLFRCLLRNDPPPQLEAEICRSLASDALRHQPTRPDSALSWFTRCRELSIDLTPGEELERGVAFALKGERDSARAVLTNAQPASVQGESGGMVYNRARILDLLGEDIQTDLLEVLQKEERLFYQDINLSLAGFLGDYYRQDAQIRRQRAEMNALLTVFTLLLLALMAVWSWLRFREQRRIWDARMVSASLLFKEQGDQLQALLTGRTQLLRQLADLYVGLDESDCDLLRKKDMDRMDLILRFRKTLRSLRKDKAFWKGFGAMLDREQDCLATRLETAFPKIAEEDLYVLMLLYAGIPAATVGILFQKPAATVRSRKARFLEDVAASQLPPREKDFFIGHMPTPRSAAAGISTK